MRAPAFFVPLPPPPTPLFFSHNTHPHLLPRAAVLPVARAPKEAPPATAPRRSRSSSRRQSGSTLAAAHARRLQQGESPNLAAFSNIYHHLPNPIIIDEFSSLGVPQHLRGPFPPPPPPRARRQRASEPHPQQTPNSQRGRERALTQPPPSQLVRMNLTPPHFVLGTTAFLAPSSHDHYPHTHLHDTVRLPLPLLGAIFLYYSARDSPHPHFPKQTNCPARCDTSLLAHPHKGDAFCRTRGQRTRTCAHTHTPTHTTYLYLPTILIVVCVANQKAVLFKTSTKKNTLKKH